MVEFQAVLAFPPAPKMALDRTLHPKRASAAELRGQALFSGKAKCVACHPAPNYTDKTMHNLLVERFFKPQLVTGMMASSDGPIKTFPLRGIEDSPPYLHDGRPLTPDYMVEYFNIILELGLNPEEKADLVTFMLPP